MKITKIIYECDVCKNKFEEENKIITTTVPCYGGERNEYNTECTIDLCDDCGKKLRKVIYDNFAQITDYYGVQITNIRK